VLLLYRIFVYIFLLVHHFSFLKCHLVNSPVVVQQQLLKCHECLKVYRENVKIVCEWWILSLGLGWATVINSFLVSIYYNVIIAWVLFYFFASFRSKLQWSDCGNWWNTERCVNPGIFHFVGIIEKESWLFHS
jgi:hypothetical protein